MTEAELRRLVDQAKSADPDAWERLYRHCYPRLLSYARRRLATSDQAEDAVAEAMARAIGAIDGFVWTGAGFDAWMFGILRNVVLETYRGRSRAAPVDPESQGERRSVDAGPLDQVLHREEAKGVRAAFARLSPADQELLELRVVAELDAESVGEVVGRAAGAVRMAQSRALGRLRTYLDAEVM